jgi:hypothetical protein
MLTQAAIERDWKTSRVYVHKCVRKGCPVDSYSAARAWRNTYARQRPQTDQKQLRLLYGDEDSEKNNGNGKRRQRTSILLSKRLNWPLPPSDSLEFSLECSRRMEEAARMLLQQALKEHQESKIVAAFRNYNAALDGRLKIEQWYRKEAEYRRHLIPIQAVHELMCKVSNVFIAKLLNLPEKIGPACNPEHRLTLSGFSDMSARPLSQTSKRVARKNSLMA